MEFVLLGLVLGTIIYALWRTLSRQATPAPSGRAPTRTPRAETVAAQRRPGPAFAVVDVETTGLNPYEDRVVEIGIVHVGPDGTVGDRWCTLVNPGIRDAGPTRIHGIETNWLAVAPTFQEVAGDIVHRLRGRVLTAHNAKFDFDFIEHEFKRIGIPLGDLKVLCTMAIADALGLPAKLSSAAQLMGVRYNSHTAVADAEVAAMLLAHGLRAGMTGHEDATVRDLILPTHLEPCGRVALRAQAADDSRPRPFLTEAMLRADVLDEGHDRNDQSYLDVLERALADGVLDPEERHQLADLANHIGLTHERAMELHHDLVLAMLDTALEDNRISKAERAQIEQAAVWLNVDLTDWDAKVKAARVRARQARAAFREKVQGMTVAFTGRGVHPQEVRQALAEKHGMTFKSRVTADTKMLVIGSDTMANQQTQKATELDIPVMLEAAFWQRLGVG